MSYIYKITNDINNKVYIGLTSKNNPIDRWTKHLSDYKTAGLYSKRPLYDAMKKYGIEHFHFEVIEETDQPQERECYWIKYYNSFISFENSNGYNATLGGDGVAKKIFSDEEQQFIKEKFLQKYSCNYISKELHCTPELVSLFLKENGYKIKSYKGNAVNQYSKDGVFIQTFPSAKQAAEFLGKTGKGGHISEVCSGKRKTAYGYKWKYNE